MSPVRKAAAAIIVGQPRAAAAGAARAPSESALALAKRPSSKQDRTRAISSELAKEIAMSSRLGSGPQASSLRLSRRAMMREQPACPAPASSSSTSPRTPLGLALGLAAALAPWPCRLRGRRFFSRPSPTPLLPFPCKVERLCRPSLPYRPGSPLTLAHLPGHLLTSNTGCYAALFSVPGCTLS